MSCYGIYNTEDRKIGNLELLLKTSTDNTIRNHRHCLLLSHQKRTINDLSKIFEIDQQIRAVNDEYFRLTNMKSSKEYPENIRMGTYEDLSDNNVYRFTTNNFELLHNNLRSSQREMEC